MGPLIFVVDGVAERRSFVQQSLEKSGYQVEAFATTRAVELAEQWRPALMIIAIELPDGSGVVLREKIRRSATLSMTPVLLVADVRVDLHRTLMQSNPQEFVSAPFAAEELLADVRAALASGTDIAIPNPLIADITIDSAAMKVFVRGREIPTTTLEFRLLDYMARHQGKVFTRDALLDEVWGDLQFVTPRSVDACIRRIRRKIESDSNAPRFLRTIRGIGYKLEGNTTWETADACHCRMCTAARTRSHATASAEVLPRFRQLTPALGHLHLAAKN